MLLGSCSPFRCVSERPGVHTTCLYSVARVWTNTCLKLLPTNFQTVSSGFLPSSSHKTQLFTCDFGAKRRRFADSELPFEPFSAGSHSHEHSEKGVSPHTQYTDAEAAAHGGGGGGGDG